MFLSFLSFLPIYQFIHPFNDQKAVYLVLQKYVYTSWEKATLIQHNLQNFES
jgi:hypothetical protein